MELISQAFQGKLPGLGTRALVWQHCDATEKWDQLWIEHPLFNPRCSQQLPSSE